MASNPLLSYEVPTTTLQAVNVILEAMGSRTIASLDSQGTDAEIAIARLGEANLEVQAEGWSFNTEEDYPIDPTVSGEIVLPKNAIRIRKVYFDGGWDKKLVVRGGKLYDRKNHTFNVGITVKVDLTVALDFEDIPQAARTYITLRAARRAAAGKLVSPTVYQFTHADELEARIRMEQEDDDADPKSMRDNPHVAYVRRRGR